MKLVSDVPDAAAQTSGSVYPWVIHAVSMERLWSIAVASRR